MSTDTITRDVLDCPSYFDEILRDPKGVIEWARELLEGVEYDTMVGTGLSGGIAVPQLAQALGKKYLIIRKAGEASHGMPGGAVGELGKRWLFVDDFISSGDTRWNVLRAVRDLVEMRNRPTSRWDGAKEVMLPPFATEYVGSYLYGKRNGGFREPDEMLGDTALRFWSNGDTASLLKVGYTEDRPEAEPVFRFRRGAYEDVMNPRNL